MNRPLDPGNTATLEGSPWRELLDVAADVTAATPRRREAERVLVLRLERLSRGERISVARRATRPVLAALLSAAGDPEIVRAAFGNPRILETDVVRVASDPRTRPTVLQTIGDSDPWSGHRAVRLALARNARTPARTALRAVVGLDARDLEALARDPAVPHLVRVRAGRDGGIDLSRAMSMGYE